MSLDSIGSVTILANCSHVSIFSRLFIAKPDISSSSCMFNDVSVVSIAGKDIFDSLSKLYVTSKLNSSKMEVNVQGQSYFKANFFAPAKPKVFLLNGRNTDANFSKGMVTVKTETN